MHRSLDLSESEWSATGVTIAVDKTSCMTRFREFSIFSALNFEESRDEILGTGELECFEAS